MAISATRSSRTLAAQGRTRASGRRVVIRDEAGLNHWMEHSFRPVTLVIDVLTPSENSRWTRAINEHVENSGSVFGALTAAAALVTYPALLLFTSVHQPERLALELLIWLSVTFVSGGVGTGIGLLRARRRTYDVARHLRVFVHQRQTHPARRADHEHLWRVGA